MLESSLAFLGVPVGLAKDIAFRAWIIAIALSYAFPVTSLVLPFAHRAFGDKFKFASWLIFVAIVFCCDLAVLRFAKSQPFTRRRRYQLLLIFAVGIALALLVSAQPASR